MADHIFPPRRGLDGPLDGYRYFACRENIAYDIRAGLVQPTPEALVDRATACGGMTRYEAAEFVGRFLGDLQRGLGG